MQCIGHILIWQIEWNLWEISFRKEKWYLYNYKKFTTFDKSLSLSLCSYPLSPPLTLLFLLQKNKRKEMVILEHPHPSNSIKFFKWVSLNILYFFTLYNYLNNSTFTKYPYNLSKTLKCVPFNPIIFSNSQLKEKKSKKQ
jgi:hypothetical protein